MELVQRLSLVQDIDLDPAAFAAMVKGGKLPAVIVIITGGTYKSSPQLLRLGYHQQFNSAGFRPHPIAICDIFSMPEGKVLEDIQKGRVLALGANYKAAITAFLTEEITFTRVALALQQVLESRVFLCNSALSTEKAIKDCLRTQLVEVTASIPIASKAVPEAPADTQETDFGFKGLVPLQQHRYMASYAQEDQSPQANAKELEEMLV